jgi:3-oxocholest-4-en-26-oate---CoA ligase
VTDWNYADVLEVVADRLPDATALIYGDVRRSFAAFDRRANGVARWLLDLGVERQDRVAQYLWSGPEYLESVVACFKAGLVPVNTNYRYLEDELAYIWNDSACAAVIFHSTFAHRVESLRRSGKVGHVRAWLWVSDGSDDVCPPWATPYEDAAVPLDEPTRAPWGRSGGDLWIIYTGGTTGPPKGVMWRQDDLFVILDRGAARHVDENATLDDVAAQLSSPAPALVACAPMMHGAGLFSALTTMVSGGPIAILCGRSFDPVELLELIQREKIKAITIIGDAFAKPILAALEARDYDISSLRLIASSGVMWSKATKDGLLRHKPDLMLVDTLGSTEAAGVARSISTGTGGSARETSSFQLGADGMIIREDGTRADVGEPGLLAVRGRGPVGYWGDEIKTASTFRVIDGERWSVPGDWATADADGTLVLLGRGAMCINSGGEKIFSEEVEEVIKTHAAILDACVVGTPDDRFGQAVTAMVELRPGANLDSADLIAHVRGKLAAYKAPRKVLVVASVGRSQTGKLDYPRLREEAALRLETEAAVATRAFSA